MPVSTDEKYRTLIERLLKATNAGRLVWHPTGKLDRFGMTYNDYRFEISAVFDNDVALGFYGNYSLDAWERLDTVHAQEFNAIFDLYELARRQALKADEAIDNLIAELEQYE